MRKIREILRLYYEHKESLRSIGRSCSVSPNTVKKYIGCLKETSTSYDAFTRLDDGAMEKMFRGPRQSHKSSGVTVPDWAYIHMEMKKKGTTLRLLWEEYRAAVPNGYQQTRFYLLYRAWKKKLVVSLRNTYKAGETMFVDYAGQTIPIYERDRGSVREAQLFVSVLGMSNLTYAEATWTQQLPDWIRSHENAFAYYGGVPKKIVPDNLKAGVSRACRYEPDINPTYHDMVVHYNTVVVPARVRRPRDKAKVECGVLIAERWILAALRNRKFFSLAELNAAVSELLERLNTKPFQKLEGSRMSWFEQYEHPALGKLPQERYQFAEWKKARVNIDYHIELAGHYYSVPYRYIHETVDVRYTALTVEIIKSGTRIASHMRSDKKGSHTTTHEHMPKTHQEYLGMTPSSVIAKGTAIGPHVGRFMERILLRREYPVQGYRSCLGIMRLAKIYPHERLDAAAARALAIGGLSYKSIESILRNNLDRERVPELPDTLTLHHENIRGSAYFINQKTVQENTVC
jgi:transposase